MPFLSRRILAIGLMALLLLWAWVRSPRFDFQWGNRTLLAQSPKPLEKARLVEWCRAQGMSEEQSERYAESMLKKLDQDP